MKKSLVAAASLALVSTSAFTADAPIRKNITPLPTFVGVNWTGIYVGLNAGSSWNISSFTHLEGSAVTGERFTNIPHGVLGGAQIGWRYKIQNNIVGGVEFAYSFRDAHDKTRTNLDNIPRSRTSEIGNVWSVSGQVGYSFDQYLSYVKAGYANTELRYSNSLIADNSVLGRSKTNVGGYVVGGGLEYAITEKISLAGEYNYYNFYIPAQAQRTSSGALAGASNTRNELSSHSAIGKLNYRF